MAISSPPFNPPNIISSNPIHPTTASLLTFRPSPQLGFSIYAMKLINLKSLSLSPKRLFRKGSSKRSRSLSSSSSASSSVHNPGSDGGVGGLTRRDLEALLGRLGAGASSQDEAEAMLREIGLGLGLGDGVGIEELVGRVGSACGWGDEAGTAAAMGEYEEELRRAFEFFDEDGDGRITAEELLRVFGGVMGDERCTLEDCRRMISGVDRNRDGFVCFEDFTRMMELQIGS